MKRKWHADHRKAGYHDQEWLPVSADDPIVGVYDGISGDRAQEITVRHLAVGPTGAPEFEIEWEDGMKVTVLDATVALQYLEHDGAVKRGA